MGRMAFVVAGLPAHFKSPAGSTLAAPFRTKLQTQPSTPGEGDIIKRGALLFVTCSVLGAALALLFLGPTTYSLAAFRFTVGVSLGLGYTSVNLPPVGAIQAQTHLPPLNLSVTLESVDLDRLQRLLAGGGAKQVLLAGLNEEGRRIAGHFFLRALFLGALGGAWGASWLWRNWRQFAHGAAIGVATILLVGTTTGLSFRVAAFQNPSYTGVLKGAPWMLGLVQQAWQGLDNLKLDVELLTRNLRQVMARANALTPLAGFSEDLKILHVSDVHNNPLGISLIAQIRDNFGPDFIVDTGDLTDFGTPLEEGLFTRFPSLGLPYYLVLGNHDSPVVAREVGQLPGVHLLDGWVEEKGIALVGQSDPGSLSSDIKPATAEAILAQVTDLSAVVQAQRRAPFLLAVHDPRVAESFLGLVPVILVGHTHQARVEKKDGSVLVNAGTTGGAGVRGLQGREEVPLTAALLYVNTKGAQPRLDAVDIIRLYPREGRFELARTMLSQSPSQDDT